MKKGFSLIELVVTIVISGIVIYSLLAVFITAAGRNMKIEAVSIAAHLATSKMEFISGKNFNLISAEARTACGGSFNDYYYEVKVQNVSAEALDLPLAVPTNYKKITVAISSDNLGSGSIEVVSLVTDASN